MKQQLLEKRRQAAFARTPGAAAAAASSSSDEEMDAGEEYRRLKREVLSMKKGDEPVCPACPGGC